MKRGILLLLAMLSLVNLNANNVNKSKNNIYENNVITFTERNIQFHVFLNGDFDYNPHYRNTTYTDYNGRRFRTNEGVRIERDYNGRVRRVGNTFINYNVRGNVKRIGNIFIDYKFGRLSKVGNLKIRYDHWGNPQFFGNVKYNDYCNNNDIYYNDYEVINNNTIYNFNDAYFYKRNFKKNYRKYKEDRNFYYYKATPNFKGAKRNKIIKRRKNKNYKRKLTPEQNGRSRRNR